MTDTPAESSTWSFRLSLIARCLLLLLIAALLLNIAATMRSLARPSASGDEAGPLTEATPWQFVDRFPTDVAEEFHFLLSDSESVPVTGLGAESGISRAAETADLRIKALGGTEDDLLNAELMSGAVLLVRYDNAGQLSGLCGNTRLTFSDLVAVIGSYCSSQECDPSRNTICLTTKSGEQWQCFYSSDDQGVSSIVCERIENVSDPHKNCGVGL